MDKPYNIAFIAPNMHKRPNNTNRLYTLGLLYLAKVATSREWGVCVLDAYFSDFSQQETLDHLSPDFFDIIGYTINSEEMLIEAEQITHQLKVLANSDSKPPKIILGGHFASTMHREILEKHTWVDHIILGEGEATLKDYLEAFEEKTDLDHIDGCAARTTYHEGEKTLKRPAIAELDNFGDIDFELMHEMPQPHEWSLVTSRGCASACKFCVIGPHWGRYKQWRGHSADWVKRHLNKLAQLGASHIQFVDDQFIGNASSVSRMKTLVARLSEEDFFLPYYCMLRADTIIENPQLIAQMKDVGLSTVFIGFESASDTVLQELNKECSPKDAESAIVLLDSLSIATVTGTISFTPWTTPISLLEDLHTLGVWFQRYPRFYLYGFNELDILENSALASQYRGNGRKWRYDWDFSSPEVKTIFDHWSLRQEAVLYPVMEAYPHVRNISVHRIFTEWQLRTLEKIINAPDTIQNDRKTSLVERAKLMSLVQSAVGKEPMPQAIQSAKTDKELTVAERCFG